MEGKREVTYWANRCYPKVKGTHIWGNGQIQAGRQSWLGMIGQQEMGSSHQAKLYCYDNKSGDYDHSRTTVLEDSKYACCQIGGEV